MDKMGLNFKRFTTCFVVFAIAFPVLIVVILMYQNSIFDLFEKFSKDKVFGRRAQNVTSESLSGEPKVTTLSLGLGARVKNISDEYLGRTDKNITFADVLPGKTKSITAMEGRAQNITAPEVGSKVTDDSMRSPTNDSTPLTKNSAKMLFDGLLASGFDEASCISRFQSYLYRKASPHKPSPYLISKLRNYEEIHRRCGPRSRDYNRTMVKLVRSKNHGSATMCKYLVWTPANGLGNRMISMAATFLYAVLTDRVLLVKFENDMMGLFCEPFLNSTWILPKDSPFRNERHVETYQSMLEKDRDNNSKENPPSVLHLNLQHTKGDPEKFFHCDHSQDLVRRVPLLILQTDQYFVPSLFMIPSFNLEITQMFPEKDTVFHHLGRYLFHPSNEAWGIISRFYKAYLARADEKIGLQIRLFSPTSTPHQAVMDLLLSCTLKHKLLPELDTKNLEASTGKNQTLKSVLVASLYPDFGENLKTMYLTKPTITGEVIGVYQPSHEEHQKFHNNKHNMKAWTEMYLLSLSDVLVTTSLSTFGYVAQGLGGLKPWLLYRLVGNETHHDPPCERDLSMEPCYHVPPKHDCKAKTIRDFSSSFPYMRPCMDYYFGAKLVNVSQ